MVSHQVRSALIGPKQDSLSRILLFAVALFVSSATVLAIVPQFEPPFASPVHQILHGINHALWWEFYALGLVASIALVTVHEQSLLSAWILAFAGGAGVGINLGVIGLLGGTPNLLFRLLWMVGLGVVTALIFGTVGYLIGTGIRKINHSQT